MDVKGRENEKKGDVKRKGKSLRENEKKKEGKDSVVMQVRKNEGKGKKVSVKEVQLRSRNLRNAGKRNMEGGG